MLTPKQILDKYKNHIPVPVIKIAKELKLVVYETTNLPVNQSGLIKKEGENFVIYVNSHHSSVRKRFTIAHEIAHFLKHLSEIGNEYVTTNKQPIPREENKSVGKRREMEIEANKFAANLLMPEKSFGEVWEKSDTIEEVADKFEVSISAATIRANSLFGEAIM